MMMSRQPRAWAESMLVAYVDGQLDRAQTEAVEAAVRDDPEAQAIIGVLRRSAAAVKGAFDAPLNEPLPERFKALLGTEPGAVVVPLARHRRASLPVRWLDQATRLAAAVAVLAVGFGAGYLTFGGDQGGGTVYVPAGETSPAFNDALYKALNFSDPGVTVSYGEAAEGAAGTITVIGGIATSFGDACREFRHDMTLSGSVTSSHGIACRDAAGGWSVLTMAAEHAPAG